MNESGHGKVLVVKKKEKTISSERLIPGLFHQILIVLRKHSNILGPQNYEDLARKLMSSGKVILGDVEITFGE